MEQYIRIPFGFDVAHGSAIDNRLVLTKEQMLNAEETLLLPEKYFCICADDGKIYFYDKNASSSVTTGKFVESEHEAHEDIAQLLTDVADLNTALGGIDDRLTTVEGRLDGDEFVKSADFPDTLAEELPGAISAVMEDPATADDLESAFAVALPGALQKALAEQDLTNSGLAVVDRNIMVKTGDFLIINNSNELTLDIDLIDANVE